MYSYNFNNNFVDEKIIIIRWWTRIEEEKNVVNLIGKITFEVYQIIVPNENCCIKIPKPHDKTVQTA